MQNEISTRRGLILILVSGTVVIFIAAVWLIGRTIPWNLLGFPPAERTTNPAQGGVNCTYPLYYWQAHPEKYPALLVLGSKTYTASEIGALLAAERASLAGQLQAQLVGAYLNISAGADQALVETTIFQAYAWLLRNPTDPLADGERQTGAQLSSILEAYNLGRAGVAACRDVPTQVLSATTTSTRTASPAPSATPTATGTPTATNTATPTVTQVFSFPTQPIPSRTPTPTPTTENPAGPPTTEPPAPTDTPEPPTPGPQPTDTQAAPPTLTPPSFPTATFTPPAP